MQSFDAVMKNHESELKYFTKSKQDQFDVTSIRNETLGCKTDTLTIKRPASLEIINKFNKNTPPTIKIERRPRLYNKGLFQFESEKKSNRKSVKLYLL